MKDIKFWAITREFNLFRMNAIDQITMRYGGDKEMAVRILEWRLPDVWKELYDHASKLRDRLKELSPDDPLIVGDK